MYIKKIIIQQDIKTGCYIDENKLINLVKDYEENPLSAADMYNIANNITKAYADEKIKAYVPKQRFANSILYINIVLPKKE